MGNYYLDTFKKALEKTEVTEEHVIAMMGNTDFFLKVLRVKFESKDPEMQKQAIQELHDFRKLLEDHQK